MTESIDDAKLFAQAMARKRREAQNSVSKFYNMVIKHEITKEPLEVSPHQDFLFFFVENHMWCVVRIPVSTGKTFSMAALTLWILGNEQMNVGPLSQEARGSQGRY